MMNKYQFMKGAFIWTAVLSAIAFILVGIFCPIEPGMTVFGHIMKCVFGWAFIRMSIRVSILKDALTAQSLPPIPYRAALPGA